MEPRKRGCQKRCKPTLRDRNGNFYLIQPKPTFCRVAINSISGIILGTYKKEGSGLISRLGCYVRIALEALLVGRTQA